jgi:hypothetical protein
MGNDFIKFNNQKFKIPIWLNMLEQNQNLDDQNLEMKMKHLLINYFI